MTEELKPCPFCGNTDVELQESHVGFSTDFSMRSVWLSKLITIVDYALIGV